MKTILEKISIALIFTLISVLASAQSTRFNLSYSYYNSFNSEINVINGDTIPMSKTGKGHFNQFSTNIFFEDNFLPGIFFGISAEVKQKNIGKIYNNWMSGDFDHRILYGYDYSLGALVKFDEVPFDLADLEINLGASMLYQSHEMNWLSKKNGNQPILFNYKRFGGRVNFQGIVSRPSYESRWIPKANILFNISYFPEEVMGGNHLAYAAEINLNLVKILQGDRFYLSPVVGFSLDEAQQVALGFSPFIAGGLSLSLNEWRADFIKIYYQKRIYQEIVPQYSLDGIYFSVNIGALFYR